MILIILIVLFLLPKQIFASGEFFTTQNTTYDIQENGSANVNHKITLKNNYSEIYPKKYSINIFGSKLSNITAYQNNRNILLNTSTDNDITKINVLFEEPSLGKGSETKFEINYQILGAAIKNGKTWEITIPQHLTDQQIININIPSYFGKISFSSIKNLEVHYLPNFTNIHISQNHASKIYLVFGNFQIFDFELIYNLENTSESTVVTEIPVPPDTSYQHVILSRIDPQPNNIIVDKDGNWLAQYILEPKQEVIVESSGQIKTSDYSNFPDEQPLPDHVDSDVYWPKDDPKIINIAKGLNTIKDVYDFTVKELSYNYDNFESSSRKGATETLLEPHLSVCTDFTDLFVTLARAKGIPSREIEGFAYTNNLKLKPTNNNNDVLHAWPQYYNEGDNRWVSVDPTWENTTNGIDYFNNLDLNHITFVIHGVDSQYPHPPGSYKNDNPQKTVFIQYSKEEAIESPQEPPLLSLVSKNMFSVSKLIVKNTNNTAIRNISIKSHQLSLDTNIRQLAPLSHIEIPINNIQLKNLLLPINRNIELSVSQDNITSFKTSIKYKPYFSFMTFIILVLISTLSIVGIIITKKGND